jgi:hypothetical protein
LTSVGSAFRINTATAGSQFDSDIAATPNKRFGVVWYDIGANSGDIKAQWLDPQGSPLGSEVTVNKTVTGAQEAPTIVATGNCLVFVAWQEFNTGTGYDIKFNKLLPFELANDPSLSGPDSFLTQAVNNQTAPFLAANPAPGNLFDIIWKDGLTGFLQGKSFSPKNSNFDTIVQISASNNGVVNGSFAYGPNNKIAFILDDNSNNSVGDGIFAATGTAGWPTAALPFTRIDPGTASNLGCHVGKRSLDRGRRLTGRCHQAKVHQLDAATRQTKQVLGLDVPVNEALLMHDLESRGQLDQDGAHLIRRQGQVRIER